MNEQQAADGEVSPGTEAAEAPPHKSEPAFNLPGSLVAVLVGLIVIHAVRLYLLSPEVDNTAIIEFAFFPARYSFPLAEQGLAWLWSPVTYSLLHGSWPHVIFNALWMVAFGAPVVRRIGTLRFALFWVVSAAAAVAFHSAFHWGEVVPVVGASGVVSALMGAAARFVFSSGGGISREFAHRNRRLTVVEALGNRSVLVFSGILFLTNLLIGLGSFALGGEAGSIAWEAHIGGFLFGFLLFAPFDRRPAEPA